MSKNNSDNLNQEMDHLQTLSDKLRSSSNLMKSPEEFLKKVKEKIKVDREVSTDERIKTLAYRLTARSKQLSPRVRFRDVGTVQHIGNGVAAVSGLPNVSIDEIVTFPTGVEGMALNLEQKRVDLIMLGSEKGIRGGDLVEATGKQLQIPVGLSLLGRIIDPLGNPLDRDEGVEASEFRVLSKIAPDVIERAPVTEPIIQLRANLKDLLRAPSASAIKRASGGMGKKEASANAKIHSPSLKHYDSIMSCQIQQLSSAVLTTSPHYDI